MQEVPDDVIDKGITMKDVTINGEVFYKISNVDAMRPFFMSLVSDANHWMFISSNGALTAGRKDNNYSLFPYYTDDKITESLETTGSKTIFKVAIDGTTNVWEPFSNTYRGVYTLTRNLYKNELGNKIIFEETNHELGLNFSVAWNSSNRFGFIRKSTLKNTENKPKTIQVLDGIQNIMPYGVNPDLQQSSSNLVDAYKKNELIKETGVGIYMLSAIIVDRAEPSEALKANLVWSTGLKNPKYLLSSLQLEAFRKGKSLTTETDIRAERGAYFVVDEIGLEGNSEKDWMLVANVNQDVSAVVALSNTIKTDNDLRNKLLEDIQLGSSKLIALTSAADGKQLTADKRRNTRHYANVLFNIMRGGIFDDNYRIEKDDFVKYIAKANKKIFKNNEIILTVLPVSINLNIVKQIALDTNDANFSRLCYEYLPLKFSRRHGDPSRPWNKFSINTQSEIDGSKILDYQGNWRDIFQNWEALAGSYPAFIESMLHKFLNATTFDGYNPYRVTKDGFDWETVEPDNPWSYIGYWGDHQIIYLLKFLEFAENHFPGVLNSYVSQDIFVYANVPYIIKSYAEILKNPKDTIAFDRDLDTTIRKRREQLGADGALIFSAKSEIVKVNLLEKLLAIVLAKCSNFIPEAGIWLNTQRPEWNDANNALVGNGVSMVTLYYMRRFMDFFNKMMTRETSEEFRISEELTVFFKAITKTLKVNSNLLNQNISDKNRKEILDGLGMAGSSFREGIYTNGFSSVKKTIQKEEVINFSETLTKFLDHSIKANRREDKLYHAYNLMTLKNEKEIEISYLSEMLEGQVAVLSSGYLSAKETVELLDVLRESKLYREDQHSYILYPNKELPRFLDKNNIPSKAVANSKLLNQLLKDGNSEIITKDINGTHHFNGNFNNADSLKTALEALDKDTYGKLVDEGKAEALKIFEEVFNHKAFTGRSGTFYGYEGLGSIYWHMVSKLVLAVQECALKAIENKEEEAVIKRLIQHYHEINDGVGVHKHPTVYGAFPTDPYSHTPAGKGAQQPGMTGQVKEDVISRFGELGIRIKDAKIYFEPALLKKSEFIGEPSVFKYNNINSKSKELALDSFSLVFTYCQVPIIYKLSKKEHIQVHLSNGQKNFDGTGLDAAISKSIFERTNEISHIVVGVKEQNLRV